MKNWKTILAISGVFLLGLLAGGLLTARLVQREWQRIAPGGPEAMRTVIVRRLTWQLRLDRTQQTQVRTIVQEAQGEMKTVRQQVQPQVTEILDRAIRQVRTVLNPSQAEKFDRLVAERRARWLATQP